MSVRRPRWPPALLRCTYHEDMDPNWLLSAAAALAAPTGVAFLFWIAIRALLRADQTERAALARMEADERANAAKTSPAIPPEGSNGPGTAGLSAG